tara:strand:- start:253 stop:465 length:213 start_codon:yes stop_codon:yes gene_type:complete
MKDKEYIVKFGIAKCFNDEENHQNTRVKRFTNKKLALKCLRRLNKFSFQDRYLAEFKVPAWTDLIIREVR